MLRIRNTKSYTALKQIEPNWKTFLMYGSGLGRISISFVRTEGMNTMNRIRLNVTLFGKMRMTYSPK